MIPGTILLPIGLLLTGWATETHCHWIVPRIVSDKAPCIATKLLSGFQGIAIVGAGAILSFQGIMTYVTDMFTLHAVSGPFVRSPTPSIPFKLTVCLVQRLPQCHSCVLLQELPFHCSLLQCTSH
jgi:hypothetical protein